METGSPVQQKRFVVFTTPATSGATAETIKPKETQVAPPLSLQNRILERFPVSQEEFRDMHLFFSYFLEKLAELESNQQQIFQASRTGLMDLFLTISQFNCFGKESTTPELLKATRLSFGIINSELNNAKGMKAEKRETFIAELEELFNFYSSDPQTRPQSILPCTRHLITRTDFNFLNTLLVLNQDFCVSTLAKLLSTFPKLGNEFDPQIEALTHLIKDFDAQWPAVVQFFKDSDQSKRYADEWQKKIKELLEKTFPDAEKLPNIINRLLEHHLKIYGPNSQQDPLFCDFNRITTLAKLVYFNITPAFRLSHGKWHGVDLTQKELNKVDTIKACMPTSAWLASSSPTANAIFLELFLKKFWSSFVHVFEGSLKKLDQAATLSQKEVESHLALVRLAEDVYKQIYRIIDLVGQHSKPSNDTQEIKNQLVILKNQYSTILQIAKAHNGSLDILPDDIFLRQLQQLIETIDPEYVQILNSPSVEFSFSMLESDLLFLKTALESYLFDLKSGLVYLKALRAAQKAEIGEELNTLIGQLDLFMVDAVRLLRSFETVAQGKASRLMFQRSHIALQEHHSFLSHFVDNELPKIVRISNKIDNKPINEERLQEIKKMPLSRRIRFSRDLLGLFTGIDHATWTKWADATLYRRQATLPKNAKGLVQRAEQEINGCWKGLSRGQHVWMLLRTQFDWAIQQSGSELKAEDASEIRFALNEILRLITFQSELLENNNLSAAPLSEIKRCYELIIKTIAANRIEKATSHFKALLDIFVSQLQEKSSRLFLVRADSEKIDAMNEDDLKELVWFQHEAKQTVQAMKPLIEKLDTVAALSANEMLKKMQKKRQALDMSLAFSEQFMNKMNASADNLNGIRLLGFNLQQAATEVESMMQDEYPQLLQAMQTLQPSDSAYPSLLQLVREMSSLGNYLHILKKTRREHFLLAFGKGGVDGLELKQMCQNFSDLTKQEGWFAPNKMVYFVLKVKVLFQKEYVARKIGFGIDSDAPHPLFNHFLYEFVTLNHPCTVLSKQRESATINDKFMETSVVTIKTNCLWFTKNLLMEVDQKTITGKFLETWRLVKETIHHPLTPFLLIENCAPQGLPSQQDFFLLSDLLGSIEFQVNTFSPLLGKILHGCLFNYIPAKTQKETQKQYRTLFGKLDEVTKSFKESSSSLRQQLNILAKYQGNRETYQTIHALFVSIEEQITKICDYCDNDVKAFYQHASTIVGPDAKQTFLDLKDYWNGWLRQELQWVSHLALFKPEEWQAFAEAFKPADTTSSVKEMEQQSHSRRRKNSKGSTSLSPRAPIGGSRSPFSLPKPEEEPTVQAAAVEPPQKSGKQESVIETNSNSNSAIAPINLSAIQIQAPAQPTPLVEERKIDPLEKIQTDLEKAIKACPIQGRDAKARERRRERAIDSLLNDHLLYLDDMNERRDEALNAQACGPYCIVGLEHMGYMAEQLLEAVMWTHPMYKSNEEEHACINVEASHDLNDYITALKEHSKTAHEGKEFHLLGLQTTIDSIRPLGLIHTTQRYNQKKQHDPNIKMLVSYFNGVRRAQEDISEARKLRRANDLDKKELMAGSWSHQSRDNKAINDDALIQKCKHVVEQADQFYDQLFKFIFSVIEHGFKK